MLKPKACVYLWLIFMSITDDTEDLTLVCWTSVSINYRRPKIVVNNDQFNNFNHLKINYHGFQIAKTAIFVSH